MISPERFTRIQTSAVATGTQPGPLVTASATPHTLGSFVSLIAATSFDAYLCGVTIKDVFASTVDTSALVNIGVDPAGGTTYTVEIPNILAGGALGAGGCKQIWFPVFFPKGSQVAAQIQGLVVSQTAIVGVVLLGGKNRSNPFPHRSRIQDYGADTATSGGTLMANASLDVKGAWTQLGADTTRRHSGLIVGSQIADAAVLATRFLVDIGIDPAGGTSYGVVLPDVYVTLAGTEFGTTAEPLGCLLGIDIPVGSSIAARAAASSNNGQADLEVAVHAF